MDRITDPYMLRATRTADGRPWVQRCFICAKAVDYLKTSPEGRLYFKTKQFYSRTTSKHISSWMPTDQAEEVEQYVIDDVVSGNGH